MVSTVFINGIRYAMVQNYISYTKKKIIKMDWRIRRRKLKQIVAFYFFKEIREYEFVYVFKKKIFKIMKKFRH